MAEKSYIQRQREQSEGAKRRRERSGDSRSNLQVRQDAEQQRKFDKAVAAGVDPATAARAFNVTREGTTDFVAIQSKEGVGVTARTKQGGRTTQAQEFFSRQEGSGSLGAEFAIPTDRAGRSPTDQMIIARSQPVPSSVAFGGPLRYAGPAIPTSRTAVGVGVPIYPVDFPVYGAPVYGRRPDSVLRAAPPRPNNRFVPDFIETPAREVGRGFRETIRNPREAGPAIRLGSGPYALGGTAAIVTGIAGFATIPQSYTGLSAVRLGLTSAVGRTAAIGVTGAGAVAAPTIGSRLAIRGPSEREFLSDPRFQQSFEEARRARTEGVGPVLGFVENVPGFGPKVVDVATRGESTRRFREAFGASATDLGVGRDFNGLNTVELGLREFESRQRAGGAGLVIGQIPGEILGRSVYQSAGVIARPGTRAFISTIPAGALEGALVFASERETVRQPVRPRDIALAMGAGALTASTTSAFIVGNIAAGRARGRVGQAAMNIIDPAEIGGDIGADILTGPRRMSPRITTILPGTVFTNVFEQSGTPSASTSSGRRGVFTFGSPTRSTVSTRTPVPADFVGSVVPMPSRTPVNSFVPARSGRSVRSPNFNFENTFVTIREPTQPFVPVGTRTPVNPFVPVNVPTRTPVFPYTPINTRTPINPFANIFTQTRNPVTPFVPTFTDFPISGFPFGGSGGGRSGFGLEGSRRRNVRNLPSLTAAFQSGFNPGKAEKSLRGRSFTGIEIRGFL